MKKTKTERLLELIQEELDEIENWIDETPITEYEVLAARFDTKRRLEYIQ